MTHAVSNRTFFSTPGTYPTCSFTYVIAMDCVSFTLYSPHFGCKFPNLNFSTGQEVVLNSSSRHSQWGGSPPDSPPDPSESPQIQYRITQWAVFWQDGPKTGGLVVASASPGAATFPERCTRHWRVGGKMSGATLVYSPFVPFCQPPSAHGSLL